MAPTCFAPYYVSLTSHTEEDYYPESLALEPYERTSYSGSQPCDLSYWPSIPPNSPGAPVFDNVDCVGSAYEAQSPQGSRLPRHQTNVAAAMPADTILVDVPEEDAELAELRKELKRLQAELALARKTAEDTKLSLTKKKLPVEEERYSNPTVPRRDSRKRKASIEAWDADVAPKPRRLKRKTTSKSEDAPKPSRRSRRTAANAPVNYTD